MTRTLSSNLRAHFASETTTIATLWKVTRQDTTVLGFTNHDADIVYDGVTYMAATGFTPSEIALKDDFSVTNHDVQSILDSSAITEADLLAGVYDYAEIQVMMVNYKAVADGVVILNRGWTGQVQVRDNTFIAEVRGLTQKINQQTGNIYSPLCRAILGDAKCTVNLASFTVASEVEEVNSGISFTDSALTQDPGYFTGGEVVWTSGNNDGLRMEVKDFLSGKITLALPMPYTIEVGDEFDIIAGCDKTHTTCKTKFSNLLNFRGEPHVPGQDTILETAGTFTG